MTRQIKRILKALLGTFILGVIELCSRNYFPSQGLPPIAWREHITHKSFWIWIHRSNLDGKMLFRKSDGTYIGISTGCLIISPSIYNDDKLVKIGWDQFNQQLSGLKQFHMIINRR